MPAARALCASDPGRRSNFKKNQSVTTNDMGQLNAHPSNEPATVCPAVPEAARAEYGAEFRDDLADFVTRETVDAVTCWGRTELPPEPGITYSAFCDPSGGVNDAMTLAVAHLREGAICVLDAILEVRPPFDPEVAVSACTAVLRRFGVTRVTGDR